MTGEYNLPKVAKMKVNAENSWFGSWKQCRNKVLCCVLFLVNSQANNNYRVVLN
jgi:hypothetical protein